MEDLLKLETQYYFIGGQVFLCRKKLFEINFFQATSPLLKVSGSVSSLKKFNHFDKIGVECDFPEAAEPKLTFDLTCSTSTSDAEWKWTATEDEKVVECATRANATFM